MGTCWGRELFWVRYCFPKMPYLKKKLAQHCMLALQTSKRAKASSMSCLIGWACRGFGYGQQMDTKLLMHRKLKWQTQAIQFWKHCLFTQTVKLDKPGTPRRTINGFELPIEAVNLQKLELNYTTTCTAVLLRLCNLTPSLTYLDLNECKEEDIFVDPDPHPPSTLR